MRNGESLPPGGETEGEGASCASTELHRGMSSFSRTWVRRGTRGDMARLASSGSPEDFGGSMFLARPILVGRGRGFLAWVRNGVLLRRTVARGNSGEGPERERRQEGPEFRGRDSSQGERTRERERKGSTRKPSRAEVALREEGKSRSPPDRERERPRFRPGRLEREDTEERWLS